MSHRSPAQHGVVQVEGAVGGGQDHDAGGRVRVEAVPQLHELRLHGAHRFVLALAPPPQDRLSLICTLSQVIILSSLWALPCLLSCLTITLATGQGLSACNFRHYAPSESRIASNGRDSSTVQAEPIPMKTMQGCSL